MYERNAHRSAPTNHRNREHLDIFLALASTTVFSVMDGPKKRGRSEGEENFGELPVTVGEQCAFLSYRYARVCEALALTEPKRGVGL